MSTHTPEEFNKICNIISEYVTMERADIDVEYLKEHGEVIVKDKAIQVLRKL
jgi:adapter protein MecA 1/2